MLFLTYEEMIEDLESAIRKICAFCNIEIKPEALPGVLERCSFAFMKQHESKFDTLMELAWESRLQLNTFFRKGQTNDWKEHLNSQQEEAFEQEFVKSMSALGMDGSRLGGPSKVLSGNGDKAVGQTSATVTYP